MKRYDFIRVSDNNNPSDFIILQINKPDIRISMLLCEYKIRKKKTKKYDAIYRFFNLDYSWYSVKRIYLEEYDKDIKNNEIDEIVYELMGIVIYIYEYNILCDYF